MARKIHVVVDQRGQQVRPVAGSLDKRTAEREAKHRGGNHFVSTLPLVEAEEPEFPTATVHHFEVVVRREGFYFRAMNELGQPETGWHLQPDPAKLGQIVHGTVATITGSYDVPKGRP